MKITVPEMRGLLKGLCLPADIRTGEYLPEYLVRKFDELQQKLDAMAVESDLARKAVQTFCDVVGANTDAICEEVGTGGVKAILAAMSATGNMPATDAYLNSVRADAVETFAVELAHRIHRSEYSKYFEDEAINFAARLRSGTHDTADKAG
ncbi:hypothetical protein [Pantoea ananatis]|uniref:hypothetical protein n=1 Tax=Pantoea ananas TaxID=553 RepID=UPI000DA6B60F|nr:hypothetical protein [Pantoea ananatis]PZD63565.1 hypothetical protein ARC272_11860 [Pantoea ananatis]